MLNSCTTVHELSRRVRTMPFKQKLEMIYWLRYHKTVDYRGTCHLCRGPIYNYTQSLFCGWCGARHYDIGSE